MARTKRRSSSPSTTPSSSSTKKNKYEPIPTHLTTEDLTPLLSLLSAATSLSFRFLSDNDLLLLPSQSFSLHSSVHSSALSLSRLFSLLNLSLQAPTPSPPPSPSPSWFLRFLSSSSSTSDPRWLENFRMSKPSFYLLLHTLTPSLQSNLSSRIPTDHKLAAALFRLAHAAPFNSIARRFGFDSPALACRAFYEVCKAVADQLGHLFELSSGISRVIQGFNWMSLPNCCGVLGFSRFPVEGSSKGGSVIAQGLVDSEGRFLDVSVGWHGLMSPSQILTKTKLYTAQSVVLASGRPSLELSGGMSVPRYFLGGSCCPLLPWLLTPFKNSGLSSSSGDVVFNTVHARGMELAERAFARVRARWHLLRMEWKEECAEALPYIVVASCLLHNYLIKCSEPVLAEVEGNGKEVGFPEFEGKRDEGGERVREVLALHLSQVIHK